MRQVPWIFAIKMNSSSGGEFTFIPFERRLGCHLSALIIIIITTLYPFFKDPFEGKNAFVFVPIQVAVSI